MNPLNEEINTGEGPSAKLKYLEESPWIKSNNLNQKPYVTKRSKNSELDRNSQVHYNNYLNGEKINNGESIHKDSIIDLQVNSTPNKVIYKFGGVLEISKFSICS